MTADAAKVAGAIDTLAARLEKESGSRKLTAKEKLVLRLNEQYPKARSPYSFARVQMLAKLAVKRVSLPS